MGEATWSIVVGYLVYITAIVFATYYYLKYKRIFLVVFIASIATYIFAVFYTWDVFDLEKEKNIVLFMLLVSTILMMFLGKYFSKLELKPSKVHTSLKEKKNEKK